MIIEKSNVTMFGLCLVQTEVCTTKDDNFGPITAVWVLPARKQLDVCTACLKKKLNDAEWTEQLGDGTKNTTTKELKGRPRRAAHE